MSFIDYLASLPALQLDQLYGSPWTCQAVLRSLPPIAKQYVLRLLFIEAPVSESDLEIWVKPEFGSKHNAAMERLQHLRLLLKEGNSAYKLNPVFQSPLRESLSAGGGPPKEKANTSLKPPTFAELDQFAVNQWEGVLLQLISISGQNNSTTVSRSGSLIEIFLRAKLLSQEPNSPPKITEQGFQFLLTSVNSQLWEILREYVAMAEERSGSSLALISFLLELGFYTVGEMYDLTSLDSSHQKILNELELFGLVKILRVNRDRIFMPTRLASTLSSSLSGSSSWQSNEGNIVVETNFRVYVYTTSRLQTEILRTFEKIEYKLPNLVVGSLTRESCNNAFSCGISAEQIVSYLVKHAHPNVASRKLPVPENVTDQIRLWEHDRNRVQAHPAVMYFEFPSNDVFLSLTEYAKDIGALLWHDAKQRRLVVKQAFHEQVKSFLRKHTPGNSAAPVSQRKK